MRCPSGLAHARNKPHLFSVAWSCSQGLGKAIQSAKEKGTHKSLELMRVRVLLGLDKGKNKSDIATDEDIVRTTVYNISKRYLKGGLDKAIYDSPRPGKPAQITPEQRAKIAELARSSAPEGHTTWTLRLLADRAVELGLVEDISHESVRNILKKTSWSLIRRNTGYFSGLHRKTGRGCQVQLKADGATLSLYVRLFNQLFSTGLNLQQVYAFGQVGGLRALFSS